MARIQFILKYRDNKYTCDDTEYSNGLLSSGLFNSARFVAQMLEKAGHVVDMVQVVDNNGIDREVTRFKPDIAIIEAYWVVPEKFEVLTRLHPTVKWVIRNHSAIPFAATESIIMDWSLRYMDYPNVFLACNDERTDIDFAHLIAIRKDGWTYKQVRERVVYLPNYYPATFVKRPRTKITGEINIACFGAIRPLKNHLNQAVAALKYADTHRLKLRFHINATRLEGRGEPILKNIRQLFANLPEHELVEHPWMPHDEFLTVIRGIDLGLQVSFTETFNIVTADMVTNDVPVVTSAEVPWVHPFFHADPVSTTDMAEAMERALWAHRWLRWWRPNLWGLGDFAADAKHRWGAFIDGVTR